MNQTGHNRVHCGACLWICATASPENPERMGVALRRFGLVAVAEPHRQQTRLVTDRAAQRIRRPVRQFRQRVIVSQKERQFHPMSIATSCTAMGCVKWGMNE